MYEMENNDVNIVCCGSSFNLHLPKDVFFVWEHYKLYIR